MNPLRRVQPSLGAYRLCGVKLLAVLLFGALLVGCGSPTVTPSSGPTGILTGTPPPTSTTQPSSATLATSPSLAAELDTCLPATGTVPSGLQGDSCPSAIAAVRALVAPLGLPIAAIYLEPGPFPCGPTLWPVPGSPPPVCLGAIIVPGTSMHGWVTFVGSPKVAAVSLHRSLPEKLATSAPTPPWQASLSAFVVPPVGWEMP